MPHQGQEQIGQLVPAEDIHGKLLLQYLTPDVFQCASLAIGPVVKHGINLVIGAQHEFMHTVHHAFRIRKLGFEQVMYDLAHVYPAYYGIAAVLLALVTGWAAGVIFRKPFAVRARWSVLDH